jgi:hypothetical protein
MNAITRALPLAMIPAAFVLAAAEPGPTPLPPILAPRVLPLTAETAGSAGEISRRADAIPADTWRGVVAREIATLVAEKPFVASRPTLAGENAEGVVVMERFVVNTPPERRVVPPPGENPILRAIRTGTLYRHVGPVRTTEAFYRFVTLPPWGTGAGKEFTRGEIGLSIRW